VRVVELLRRPAFFTWEVRHHSGKSIANVALALHIGSPSEHGAMSATFGMKKGLKFINLNMACLYGLEMSLMTLFDKLS
jgi:hypothetical protein